MKSPNVWRTPSAADIIRPPAIMPSVAKLIVRAGRTICIGDTMYYSFLPTCAVDSIISGSNLDAKARLTREVVDDLSRGAKQGDPARPDKRGIRAIRML
jgi:hypothetical protein